MSISIVVETRCSDEISVVEVKAGSNMSEERLPNDVRSYSQLKTNSPLVEFETTSDRGDTTPLREIRMIGKGPTGHRELIETIEYHKEVNQEVITIE